MLANADITVLKRKIILLILLKMFIFLTAEVKRLSEMAFRFQTAL